MQVINSQWLYQAKAVLVKKTAQTITVRVGDEEMKFWRKNMFEFGYSRIFRRGDEPSRLVLEDGDEVSL